MFEDEIADQPVAGLPGNHAGNASRAGPLQQPFGVQALELKPPHV